MTIRWSFDTIALQPLSRGVCDLSVTDKPSYVTTGRPCDSTERSWRAEDAQLLGMHLGLGGQRAEARKKLT